MRRPSWLVCIATDTVTRQWCGKVHLRMLSLAVPRWKRAAAGRRPKDRSQLGGSLVSPGLASQRDRFPTAKQGRLRHQRHSSSTPRCRGMGTLRDGRPADCLPPGTVGQWPPAPGNGGPCTKAASRQPTKRGRLGPRADIPKRLRPNCQKKEVLSTHRGLQHTKRGRGPKTPLSEGKGPENPGVVAPFAFAGLSRQPHARGAQTVDEVRPTSLPSSSTAVTVLWRRLQFLDKFVTLVTPDRCRVFFDKVVDVPVVLCNGVPQVQSVISVAYERHVTSMTHRIACLRAVLATALPLFHQVAGFVLVSTDQRTGPSSCGVLCPTSGFLPFPLFTGFGYFPNFWVQPSRPRLPARVGPFTSSVCKVLRVEFLAKF